MTMTTTAPAASRCVAAGEAEHFVVLSVSSLPKHLRACVEKLMWELLPATSQFVGPVADPLTAAWCTSWSKDAQTGTVTCRELISAPLAALENFRAAVEKAVEGTGARIELLALW